MNGRECGVCGREMTMFTSQDDKKIFMCPCCCSIYLPVETRDERIIDYEYSYEGTFFASGNIPTRKQASYIKVLCSQLNLKEIDVYSMTKEEAINLISELKERVDKECCTIQWTKVKIEEDTYGEYVALNNKAIIKREWLKEYKNNLHQSDNWTNVNLETYIKNIHKFNIKEAKKLICAAKENGVLKII